MKKLTLSLLPILFLSLIKNAQIDKKQLVGVVSIDAKDLSVTRALQIIQLARLELVKTDQLEVLDGTI